MPQSLVCPTCNAPIPFHTTADPMLTCPFCGKAVPTPADWGLGSEAGGLSGIIQQAMQLRAIAELARAGNKIEAIKQYRALTGLGLKEAKDAVEQMAAGQVAVQINSFSTASASADPARWAEIQRLVQGGQKLEAIKLFRELTGAGLKEAKDAVEQMEANQNFDASAIHVTSDAGPDATLLAVQTLIGMGKKMEAVIVYRDLTGVGLKEAKDAVEALERGNSAPDTSAHSTFNIPPASTLKYPQSPSVVSPEQNSGRGCLVWGVVIGFIVLAMLASGVVLIFALMR